MTEETGFNWVQAHAGALSVGVVTFFFFIFSGANPVPSLVLAVILILLVAGLAWLAYRKGKRELAMGMVAGYAILSLISGGQCTLFRSAEIEGPFGAGASTGFFVYLALLVVAPLIGGIVAVIIRARRRKEGRQ